MAHMRVPQIRMASGTIIRDNGDCKGIMGVP